MAMWIESGYSIRPSRPTLIAAILAVLVAAAASANGGMTHDVKRISDWLEAEWDQGRYHPALPDFVFSWHVEYRIPDSEAQGTHDDHSSVADADTDTHVRSSRSHFALRARGRDDWRLCVDSATNGEPSLFIDSVATPSYLWRLTPSWLIVADPLHDSPETREIRRIGRSAARDLSLMFRGGMDLQHFFNLETVEVSFDEDIDQWTCFASSRENDKNVRFKGIWRHDLDRGFVNEAILDENGSTVRRWRFYDWTYHSNTGLWIAGRTEIYGSGTAVERVLEFESARREPTSFFGAATVLPDFGTADAIRGPVRLMSISDLRPNPEIERILTANGIVEFDRALPARWRQRIRRRARFLGWSLVGSAALILLYIRFQRARFVALSHHSNVLEQGENKCSMYPASTVASRILDGENTARQ